MAQLQTVAQCAERQELKEQKTGGPDRQRTLRDCMTTGDQRSKQQRRLI